MSRTVIRTIEENTVDGAIIDEAVRLVNAGFLIVVPTETRYALVARADDPIAIDKLYQIKGRSKQIPTAVFVNKVDEIKDFGVHNKASEKLANKFLPGKMTLVLKAAKKYQAPVVVNDRIGIRVSSSPVIAALIEKIDFPLSATSANLSGQSDPETVEEIARIFGSKVGFYINGGRLAGDVSTVIDLSEENFVILREGAISTEAVEACING